MDALMDRLLSGSLNLEADAPLGAVAFPAGLRLLDDPDADNRALAAELLGEAWASVSPDDGALLADVAAALGRAASDADEQVRAAAVQALRLAAGAGRGSNEVLVEVLARRMSDGSETVSLQAVRAFWQLRWADLSVAGAVRDTLLAALSSPWERVRGAAVMALQADRDRDDVRAALLAAAGSSPEVARIVSDLAHARKSDFHLRSVPPPRHLPKVAASFEPAPGQGEPAKGNTRSHGVGYSWSILVHEDGCQMRLYADDPGLAGEMVAIHLDRQGQRTGDGLALFRRYNDRWSVGFLAVDDPECRPTACLPVDAAEFEQGDAPALRACWLADVERDPGMASDWDVWLARLPTDVRGAVVPAGPSPLES
jgi:hypothetical protein